MKLIFSRYRLHYSKNIFSPGFNPWQGTCFTSTESVAEENPSSVASIRVWLNMNESTSPSFEIAMRGSDAAERKGVIWTLSHDDHPLGVLLKDFNRVPRGTVTAVGMKVSTVSILTYYCYCNYP